MTKASICRLSKEIQEIASSTYFGRPLSQLYKQHFESVMPISVSPMFKQTAPGKGMWLVLQSEIQSIKMSCRLEWISPGLLKQEVFGYSHVFWELLSSLKVRLSQHCTKQEMRSWKSWPKAGRNPLSNVFHIFRRSGPFLIILNEFQSRQMTPLHPQFWDISERHVEYC